MKLIFWLIVIGAIYWLWNSYEDPATDKSLILSNPSAEAYRQEIIRTAKENHIEGYPLYTDEESHIILQREYERADQTPDFIVVVFLILLGSIWGAVFGNAFSMAVSIVCCLILIIFGCYQWIVLAMLLEFIIIPTLFCMGIQGLFSK